MYSHDGPNGLGLSIGIGPIDVGIPLPGGGSKPRKGVPLPVTWEDVARLMREDGVLSADLTRIAISNRGRTKTFFGRTPSSGELAANPDMVAQVTHWWANGGADDDMESWEREARSVIEQAMSRASARSRQLDVGPRPSDGAVAPSATSTAVSTVVGLGIIGAILASALKKR